MSKVKDKATAFKNEVAGSQTNKILCKASSHEVAGPKKKHVDFLLQLTNHPKCQFGTLVDLIAERLRNNNWVVVFKALIVSHNLMSLGSEKFLQAVATRNHIFELDNFVDRTDVLSTDMSSYLRKYARYVRHLCICYKALAVDICRIPKGENSPYRNMEVSKILKSATIVQDQLDLLLELEFATNELTNGVINTAFLMLYKDLIKLYSVYNDALINLLEKFFEMKKSECKETMGVYRKFLMRQESIQRFLQLAEEVGVDKETHLNLRQVPEDLLPALESHLTEMEGTKKSSGAQPSPQIKAASERLQELREKDLRKNAVPNQSGSGIISGYPSASPGVLEAQRKRFEELKKRASEVKMNPEGSTVQSDSAFTPASIDPPKFSSNPSGMGDLLGLSSNTAAATTTTKTADQTTFDPWGSSSGGPSIPQAQQVLATSSNPFSSPSSTTTAPSASFPAATSASSNPWGSPAGTEASSGSGDPWSANNSGSANQEIDLFSELRGTDFNAAFGGGPSPTPPASSSSGGGGGISLTQYTMGDILTPQAVGVHATQEVKEPVKVGLTTDVDSSLARAAANLTMDANTPKTGFTKKTDHQWTAPKKSVKTGGDNWQKQTLQAATLPPGGPMQSKPVNWSGGMQAGHFPVQPQPTMMQPGMMPGMMGAQPGMMGGGMQPMMGGGGGMMMGGGGMGMGMGGGMGMGQPMMQQQQPMMGMQPRPFMQQPAGMQPTWPGQPQQQGFGNNSLL